MKMLKQCEKEVKEKQKEVLTKLAKQTKEELLNDWAIRKYYLTARQYKKLEDIAGGAMGIREAKAFVKEAVKNYYAKVITKRQEEITKIMWAEPIRGGQAQIEWVRNNTWGYCPRGGYRNGHFYQEYRSITGCGYDKLSTLTAEMFNADSNLISFICRYCEKHNINKDNIESKLGYGIRIYMGLPHFSDGVGIECHKRILEKMSFRVRHYETKHSDILDFELTK